MNIDYKPNGICARRISFKIENGHVYDVQFEGGCTGNQSGISRLVEGMEVSEVVKKLRGIKCGGKQTSCPDQLAKALEDKE